jgi:signal transduction histidine kinase
VERSVPDRPELSRVLVELAAARLPGDVAHALHADGLPWLGVDGLALYRLSHDGLALELVRPPVDVRERLAVAVWIPLGGPALACKAARSGAAIRASGRTYVPLVGDAGVIGVLVLARSEPPHGSDGLVALIEACRRALDRAIQFEGEHRARAEAEAVTARLQREIEARDRSIAMLVHDLRNPLAAITMSARMLAEAPDAGRGVARIGRSAERMQRMIDQLLSFAKLRHGEALGLEPRACDLMEIASDCADEARTACPRASIDLQIADGVDPRGTWDPVRIAEVVANLIANAIDHGADARVALRVGGDAETVTLEVENRGSPIPPARLPTIFEPFQHRGQPPRGRGRRGLGLGLYITRAVVEAHGGSIAVVSDEAATVFRVRLPRAAS